MPTIQRPSVVSTVVIEMRMAWARKYRHADAGDRPITLWICSFCGEGILDHRNSLMRGRSLLMKKVATSTKSPAVKNAGIAEEERKRRASGGVTMPSTASPRREVFSEIYRSHFRRQAEVGLVGRSVSQLTYSMRVAAVLGQHFEERGDLLNQDGGEPGQHQASDDDEEEKTNSALQARPSLRRRAAQATTGSRTRLSVYARRKGSDGDGQGPEVEDDKGGDGYDDAVASSRLPFFCRGKDTVQGRVPFTRRPLGEASAIFER